MVKVLGIQKKDDTCHLRDLACEEVTNNIQLYENMLGMTNEQLHAELSLYKEQGYFNCNLTDIAVKICSEILQVPIITSFPRAAHLSFFPQMLQITDPLFLAFDHNNPGHYDAPKGSQFYFYYHF